MVKDIQINTDKTKDSYLAGHTVEVTAENPWDPLSKAFTKYKHTIKYPYRSSVYEPSEYYITVHVPSRSGSNKFTYKEPKDKVFYVEIFFRATDDPSSKDPLIVGFISPNWREGYTSLGRYSRKGCKSSSGEGSKCYYTWTYLKDKKKFTGDIDVDGSIREKELVTVLLEEIGHNISRPRKLVIRLGEKPDVGRHVLQYPDSGHYSEHNRKITVRKVEDTVVTGFDIYEHSIDTSVYVSDFYVSYLNNSRYFKIGYGSGYGNLMSVTAYFETGSKKLVLITFYLTSGTTHVYSYYDFVNELKGLKNWSTDDKIIKTLTPIGRRVSDLQRRLQQESERLKELISFVEGGSSGVNKNIKTEGPSDLDKQGDIGKGYTFKKVTLRPASAGDKPDGSSGGPWIVYNNLLISREKGMKIQNDREQSLLNSIYTIGDDSNKYKSITVYYTLKDSNYKALLVEFVEGGGGISNRGKLYIKRTDAEGKKWNFASADYISGGGTVNEGKLTQIAREAGIIEGITTTISSDGSSSSYSSAVGEGGSVGNVSRSNDKGVNNTARDPAVGSTGDNHSGSDSRTTYGQASPQAGDKKDNESDDIISTTVKIAGGVAGTAIGAGAIGGGAHYANGVIGVIKWLI
ncbi:hypothetical protein MACJ_002424 [Theileria orientalis]|uniref:Uncharacterized protein n=1 Tax=Theileria orientalis TaxID=68886 RepID=A0A976M662_THEOR|nr:hypothetical protein MACJ_002424 [Theileria orientalis]